MRTIAFLATLSAVESHDLTWTFGKNLSVPLQPGDKPIPYAHGLEVDKDDRVFLTYWDQNTTRRACLIRWDPAGDDRKDPSIVGDGKELPMCVGGTGSYGTDSVHGIRIVEEPCEDGNGKTCQYMYHANNNQGLFKTDLDGNLKWATYGEPGKPAKGPHKPTSSFTPTWFDKQPGSKYLYLADGYGSSKIYVYDTDGHYQNISFDGTENGGTKRFNTPHAISWDWRLQKMVVSDRTNKRLVYYDIDMHNPKKFKYHSELAVDGQPCNMRFWTAPHGEKLAVVPVLEGKVYVYEGKHNKLVHTIDVTGDMTLRTGHDDPHDAIFTKKGDIVVGTYADGYVGYYKFGDQKEVQV